MSATVTQLVGGLLLTGLGVLLLVVYRRSSATEAQGFRFQFVAAMAACFVSGPLALLVAVVSLIET